MEDLAAFSAREVKTAAAKERIRVGIPLQKNSESQITSKVIHTISEN